MAWLSINSYTIPQEEWDALCKRVSSLQARVDTFEMVNKDLRDKVLRKIQRPQSEPHDENAVGAMIPSVWSR